MTTEAIILGICGLLFLAIFLAGEDSILVTFDEATPRLAAKVERNVTIGNRFYDARDGSSTRWNPSQGNSQ